MMQEIMSKILLVETNLEQFVLLVDRMVVKREVSLLIDCDSLKKMIVVPK